MFLVATISVAMFITVPTANAANSLQEAITAGESAYTMTSPEEVLSNGYLKSDFKLEKGSAEGSYTVKAASEEASGFHIGGQSNGAILTIDLGTNGTITGFKKSAASITSFGEITKIVANFTGNSLDNEDDAEGIVDIHGMEYVSKTQQEREYNIREINGNFTDNNATAVNNDGGKIGFIVGDFTRNHGQIVGGAIFNDTLYGVASFDNGQSYEKTICKGTIDKVSGNFIGNSATYAGGAIFNAGTWDIGLSDEERNAFASLGLESIPKGIFKLVQDDTSITIGEATFTGNTAPIGGAIFNTGIVNLSPNYDKTITFGTGKDNADDIFNAGTLNINSGYVVVNSRIYDEDINGTKMMVDGEEYSVMFKKTSPSTINITSREIDNGSSSWEAPGKLTLGEGATITQDEINVENYGTLNAFYPSNKINAKLTIRDNGNVEVHANAITSDVTNNGKLALFTDYVDSVTWNNKISGNGLTAIFGNVINNSLITQKSLWIWELDDEGKIPTLTTNADNLAITENIKNGGNLILTGGTNKNNIENLSFPETELIYEGKTIIAGDVVNNATISQNVEIQSGNLTTLISNITRDITVLENSKLSFSDTSAITCGNTINMNKNSTLNILNGTAATNTLNNLKVASAINLEMDWEDVLEGTDGNINGKINISKIDISNESTKKSYAVSSTITGTKFVLSDDITLVTSEAENADNFVTYKAEDRFLSRSAISSVEAAIANTSEGIVATYAMGSGSEDVNGSLTGSLTVQGDSSGSAISGNGIVVGYDSTASTATTGAALTLKDVDVKDVAANASQTGAIQVNGGNKLNIIAENNNVTLSGSKDSTGKATSVIRLEKTGGQIAEAAIEAIGGEITISDSITSSDSDNKIVFKGTKDINFNGEFDPVEATVSMTGAQLIRGGQDTAIDWILNGGTLRYTNDAYLAGGTNSINFAGGALDLRNGAANTIDLTKITLSADSSLYLDVDLAAGEMDNFELTAAPSATNLIRTGGNITVAGLSLISDAKSDNTTINFVDPTLTYSDGTTVAGSIVYTTTSGLTAVSPIYTYTASYAAATGDFTFTRSATGGIGDYNPAVMASAVGAQVGGYLTQLDSYNQAFSNMDMYMLMTKSQRQAMKNANKYAAADSNRVFIPTNTPYEEKSAWFRPYTTFENVGLKGGNDVSNVTYGTFAGVDSELYDLGNGWDGSLSIYAGYNGSHQAYMGNSIYQNGATLGLAGMAYKDNFFTGLTANVGYNIADATTMYGKEDFSMLMTGVASKTGYNYELADGKFIIQPSMTAAYSFVNTFDYTNAAGVRITSDPMHAIQLEPGVKFIGNLKNGWQPYAGISAVWNIMDKTQFKANDVSLPDLSVKPYARYGLGVRKMWKDRFAGFAQMFFTSGGRNGVGFQFGFKWTLGK